MNPTPRHYEFAREYAKGTDVKAAAIKAGFSEKTASDRAYEWIGKNRSDSKYPELWDLVQELRQEANDGAAETIRKMGEVLQRIWYEGYDTRWLFGGDAMPFAVETKDKLMAMTTHQKLLPLKPETEVTVNMDAGPNIDLSKLSDEELRMWLELSKKASK